MATEASAPAAPVHAASQAVAANQLIPQFQHCAGCVQAVSCSTTPKPWALLLPAPLHTADGLPKLSEAVAGTRSSHVSLTARCLGRGRAWPHIPGKAVDALVCEAAAPAGLTRQPTARFGEGFSHLEPTKGHKAMTAHVTQDDPTIMELM